jgi:hypothetical protein
VTKFSVAVSDGSPFSASIAFGTRCPAAIIVNHLAQASAKHEHCHPPHHFSVDSMIGNLFYL